MEKICMTCRWSVSTDGGCYCIPTDEHQHPEHWCRFWERGIDKYYIYRNSKKARLSSVYGICVRRDQNGTDTGEPGKLS